MDVALAEGLSKCCHHCRETGTTIGEINGAKLLLLYDEAGWPRALPVVAAAILTFGGAVSQ